VNSKVVVPDVFSRHAAAYSDRLAEAFKRGEARGRLRVLELLAVGPGERIVDLGCGPGTLTFPLADAAGSRGFVAGVDLAPGMLLLAGAQGTPTVAFARMDIERLAFADAVFDAVACGHSLQFCPDLDNALREARRVLRRDGRFAASVPLPPPRRHHSDDVLDGLLPLLPVPTDAQETRVLLGEEAGARSALLRAGFRTAIVEQLDEVSQYRGPSELVAKAMSWWAFARRLELLPEAERRRVQAEAVERLRELVGSGPLEIPGASLVIFARN